MKHHIATATATLVAGLMLAVPGTALAQNSSPNSTAPAAGTSTPLSTSTFTAIPVTGKAGTKTFKGTYTVDRYVTKNGSTFAVGTLTGKVGKTRFTRKNVLAPASIKKSSAKTAQAGAVCQIVNLVLGPIHLNVLGLHVDTNTIVANITAVRGAGQLLGNLLCAVANLLNGVGTGGATPPALTPAELTGLLNTLLQLGNVPALSTL
jgi:hypothetical protein